jgi:hydroxyacylglutathione hydrolase
MSQLISYVGGDLATNGYLLSSAGGFLCVDAPEGMAAEIQRRGAKVEALLLTHGHFDHIWDAAAIERDHGCPVYAHPADAFMIRDTTVFRMFGIHPDLVPVRQLSEIAVPEKGSLPFSCGGMAFTLFHIPGHSPGSIVFYEPEQGIILGGDVLFAGGVGRWDLPLGSQHDLLEGIRKHLLVLPDAVKVFSGHGPATTIGIERESNPFLDGTAGL